MNATSIPRSTRSLVGLLALVAALLVCGPTAPANAAAASPDGDAIAVGDPDALGHIDLYLDPLCPYSGKLIREKGDQIATRIESGALRVNLRFVDFLDHYSASGSYDTRAINAAYVVSDQSRSSDVTWRFVERIYSADQQPKEKGATDLTNDDLADLAAEAGAPPSATNAIRVGVPIGYDPRGIAARNYAVLHTFPEPGVPLVVLDDQPVDADSDWLAKLPR